METRSQSERRDRSRARCTRRSGGGPDRRGVLVRLALAALPAIFAITGCTGTSGRGSAPPPPPPAITVTIQPGSATLFLGQTQQFAATVTGSSNIGVTWAVNGVPGGNATAGTISGSGLYTAPAILPAGSAVSVSATSVADATARAEASVALQDDIAVSVSPDPATVPAGSTQVFTAAVSGSGSPATGVTWSVNGLAGGNSALGTIAATGSNSAAYTAPAAVPAPPNVTLTATSVADTAKSGSASVTITCANLISPASASVSLGGTQTLTASLCVASGTEIAWDVNGAAGGNASLGTIAADESGGAHAAVYTAPADLPSTNPVSIHATGGTAAALASITITSSVSVSVVPSETTLGVSERATFAATVTNSPDTGVNWSVNGVPNGNAAVGQICVAGTDPCVSPNGAISGIVDYLAPAAAPGVNPVAITATSRADPMQTGSASVFIATQTGPITVSVSPLYAFVVPSSAQPSTMQFFASVSGTNATGVTWSVQSGVAGQGCGGAACGSIDGNGVYTAPPAAPSPNAIAVIATSVFDTTKSGSAAVAITSGPTIRVLLPSSVMAGAMQGFPFQVQGVNFAVGSGGSGSVILLNGQPRSTTCASAGACTTALNPSDVQTAGTMTVQIQNPGAPGALSNIVPFVIVPFDVSVGALALGLTQPAAGGENIVVAEATTAASSPINVDFVGFLSGGSCGVQGSPLTVARPGSGSATVSLCVHGNGLDPSFAYAFSAPSGGADIGVAASSISGIFPNMIELDVTLSSATVPGVRSLFITTLNNDRAVATGVLEVK